MCALLKDIASMMNLPALIGSRLLRSSMTWLNFIEYSNPSTIHYAPDGTYFMTDINASARK